MQDPEFVKGAFGAIAGRYVAANHVLSGGLDILWRNRTAHAAAAEAPREVLDVATGSGDLAAAVQRKLPDAGVIGVDFCPPMLAHARKRGLRNLVVGDGMRLPFGDGAFDLVTVAFGLRNMESYPGALAEMGRVLRPGGVILILDFSLPVRPLRGLYRFYLHRVLPLVAGWLTGKPDAYRYLGGSIEAFPSGEAMCRMIEENGFRSATRRSFAGGIASLYTGRM